MTTKIVITDDHSIIREGIKSVLAPYPEYEVAAEAANGIEALECVKKWKPDILLLDITMPELGGLDILAQVKEISPQTRVIIISVHELGAYVLKAMRQGASAYLNKNHVAEELIPALRKVVSGKVYLGETVSQYLTDAVRTPDKNSRPSALLSERELDVLRLTVEGRTAREIAKVLFLSPRTVENYKNSILKKLNLHKTSDLIKYAFEHKILE